MKNKNRFMGMSKNYTKIPDKAFLIPDAYAKLIFFTCLSFGEEYNPTIRDLVKHSGLSNKTVIKSIDKLISYNILKKISNYTVGKYATKYEFIDPKEWVLLS